MTARKAGRMLSRTHAPHSTGSCDHAAARAMADGGWLGITTPEEYGGHGMGITEASILLEEVAASGAGMNGASSMHLSIFGMHPVIVHGSEELKQRTLPRIVSGDLHVCFGVTEPGAGLDTDRKSVV